MINVSFTIRYPDADLQGGTIVLRLPAQSAVELHNHILNQLSAGEELCLTEVDGECWCFYPETVVSFCYLAKSELLNSRPNP